MILSRVLTVSALGLLIGCGGAAPKPSASAPEAPRKPIAAAATPAPTAAEPDDNFHCGSDAKRCTQLGTIALLTADHKADGRAMLEKGCTLGSTLACVNLGKSLYNGAGGDTDRPRALTLWTKACTDGDGDGCRAQGDVTVDQQPAVARKAYERGCSVEQRDCCANFALMLAKGDGGPQDDRGAVNAAELACKKRAPLGCLVLGLMKRDGQGTAQDLVAAKAAFHAACEAGKTEGCDAEEDLGAHTSASARSSGAEGTMSAGSVTMDGQTLKGLSCDMASGGPLGMLAISAGLRARKTQLDACAAGGETETKVVLHAKSGRFAAVEAKGKSAAIGKCVERALVNQRAPFDGTCSATLVHGKK